MVASRTRPPDGNLHARLAQALHEAGVERGARLTLAFSGGLDSRVLLELLADVAPGLGLQLDAAHVHHGLSAHAEDWVRLCEAACAGRGLPLRVFRVQVPQQNPLGLEAAARQLRHAALDSVVTDWLVFAHHQDDQAETLLFRLLRGSGVRGAAAMRARVPAHAGRPGRLRPLLNVRRAELEAFARAAGLRWVEDESNADTRFARNFLRHRIMPELQVLAPAAVPALARAAGQFAQADELLEDLAQLDLAQCGGLPMRHPELLALSDARLLNLLRSLIRELGEQPPARARLLEAVRQLREAPGPLCCALGACTLLVYRDRVWLESARPAAQPVPRSWCGERALPWSGGEVCFEPVSGAGLDAARLAGAGACRLVPRWPGLKMRMAPEGPRRSFKNLCQEAGIPAFLRERLPVLVVDGEPVWIAGIGCAPAWRCTSGQPGVQPRWDVVGANFSAEEV